MLYVSKGQKLNFSKQFLRGIIINDQQLTRSKATNEYIKILSHFLKVSLIYFVTSSTAFLIVQVFSNFDSLSRINLKNRVAWVLLSQTNYYLLPSFPFCSIRWVLSMLGSSEIIESSYKADLILLSVSLSFSLMSFLTLSAPMLFLMEQAIWLIFISFYFFLKLCQLYFLTILFFQGPYLQSAFLQYQHFQLIVLITC